MSLCNTRGSGVWEPSLLDTFAGRPVQPYLILIKTENADLTAWFSDLLPTEHYQPRRLGGIQVRPVIDFFMHNGFVSTPDLGVILTPTVRYDGAAIHRTYYALFQEIIRAGSPARAIQTLYTVLMQMAYYDFLPQFDVAVPATISVATTTSISSQWKGFIAVAVLSGVRLLAVVAMCVLLWQTERLLLGNAWQTVAQAITERTLPVLATSADSTDGEVRRGLTASGVAPLEGVTRRRH